MRAHTPGERGKSKHKKADKETLEVVCRLTPYNGCNPCLILVDENTVECCPPNGVLQRNGQPYVSVFSIFIIMQWGLYFIDDVWNFWNFVLLYVNYDASFLYYIVQANKVYEFGRVFDDTDTQKEVFERCSVDLIEHLITGRNALLFTYGVRFFLSLPHSIA